MNTQLPPPQEIATHYNSLMKDLGGDYIHSRWGDSEIKRRHYRHTEDALRKALARVPSPGNVLEIGCGPAVWTPLFLGAATGATLLDISDEMLRKARARLEEWEGGRHADKVRYRCGDFIESEVPDGPFDTIVSSRAFEYMSDKPRFVQKCFDLLAPGGTLVLVTKNRDWRDLRKTKRDLRGVPRERIPVGVAMQLDLASWGETSAMFDSAGFRGVEAYPVIFGSYMRPFVWPGGLAVGDALQKMFAGSPITRAIDPVVESYLVAGRKPA